MDHCDCGSLRDLTDYREKILTETQIDFLLHDALMALAEFKTKHRVIHHDIKTSNIFVKSKCEVKGTNVWRRAVLAKCAFYRYSLLDGSERHQW
jgi:serine/threonine protein kinase